MKQFLSAPLVIWSVRDVMRHPLEWLLLTLSITLITAIPGMALLLVQGLTAAAHTVLADSPSLIIRKIEPAGWQPVPVDNTLAVLRHIPGVVRVYPRIWGVVTGPDGPLTVIGTRSPETDGPAAKFEEPGPGQALIGPGIGMSDPAGGMDLIGRTTKSFKVIGQLDRQTAIVSNDIVVLNPVDALQLLGLPEGYASDIAVDVYHTEEETAIIPDLIQALPWPARISTRTDSLEYYAGAYARRGGIVIMAILPALTALCFLVAATVKERLGRRYEVGLLKALGWTTPDIVRHFIFRALFIGLPAVCLGMILAYGSVFWPGIQWPGTLLFGWQGQAPHLYLDTGGSILVLVQIASLTLAPYLAATLVPALTSAAVDTQTALAGGDR